MVPSCCLCGQANGVKMSPRDVALRIVEQILPPSTEVVERLEVAGPGFVNIWLKPQLIQDQLNALLDKVR